MRKEVILVTIEPITAKVEMNLEQERPKEAYVPPRIYILGDVVQVTRGHQGCRNESYYSLGYCPECGT